MRVGDVIFSKYNGGKYVSPFIHFMQKLIMKYSRSDILHVGICIGVQDDGRYQIAESLMEGFVVNVYTPEQLKDSRFLVVSPKGLRRSKVYTEAMKIHRKGYAFFDYVKFITYFITGKKFFKSSTKRMVCSESVSYILYKCGVDIRPKYMQKGEDFDYIDPAYVYRRLALLNS